MKNTVLQTLWWNKLKTTRSHSFFFFVFWQLSIWICVVRGGCASSRLDRGFLWPGRSVVLQRTCAPSASHWKLIRRRVLRMFRCRREKDSLNICTICWAVGHRCPSPSNPLLLPLPLEDTPSVKNMSNTYFSIRFDTDTCDHTLFRYVLTRFPTLIQHSVGRFWYVLTRDCFWHVWTLSKMLYFQYVLLFSVTLWCVFDTSWPCGQDLWGSWRHCQASGVSKKHVGDTFWHEPSRGEYGMLFDTWACVHTFWRAIFVDTFWHKLERLQSQSVGVNKCGREVLKTLYFETLWVWTSVEPELSFCVFICLLHARGAK